VGFLVGRQRVRFADGRRLNVAGGRVSVRVGFAVVHPVDLKVSLIRLPVVYAVCITVGRIVGFAYG
jgi:hypothetical protein